MLLNDLLKLFSTNFNINEERFIDIIESNNIKLSQRLLVMIKPDKQLNVASTNINVANSNNNNNNNNNISGADLNKKEPSGRGRGRPRKTKEITEESNIILEVEIIVIGEKEYYKTNENVLMNMDMEIVGIYQDGKVCKKQV